MLRIRVEGDNKVQVGFKLFGKEVRSLSSAWARISKALSATGKATAVTMFKNPTGQLAASVRAGKAKKYASATAGNKGTPYAAVQHWGWPVRNIRAVNYMYEARESVMPYAVKTVGDELGKAARRAGLE